MVRISRRRKKDGRKERQHTQDARKEGEESTLDDQQPDRRGTQRLGVKHNYRACFAFRFSAKMRGGGRGQKTKNAVKKKKNRTTKKKFCATLCLVPK